MRMIWSNSQTGNYSYLPHTLLPWQDQTLLQRLKAVLSLPFIWKYLNRRYALHSCSLCSRRSGVCGRIHYLQFAQETLTLTTPSQTLPTKLLLMDWYIMFVMSVLISHTANRTVAASTFTAFWTIFDCSYLWISDTTKSLLYSSPSGWRRPI